MRRRGPRPHQLAVVFPGFVVVMILRGRVSRVVSQMIRVNWCSPLWNYNETALVPTPRRQKTLSGSWLIAKWGLSLRLALPYREICPLIPGPRSVDNKYSVHGR